HFFAAFGLSFPISHTSLGVLYLAFVFHLRRFEIVAIGGCKFKWFAVRARARDVIMME
ncbi:hypothetical protein PHMEG_00020148, partial [Phytophthora megakarya]